MKRILTLVLCWLLAFSAMAETTFKAKTAASVAGGYVTSMNKVDGSFEDGVSSWSASVGTIVQTASTEFQGNYKGVWSGTGAGTLDLQWTATASNTYEASAQVNVQGEDDVYVCAYVGTAETGCKLIPALNKIQKVSVVADSVISSAFYLRLKYAGSDAFSIDVDDGKIEPWTPQAVNLVEQEGIVVKGYTSGTAGGILFKTKDALRSNEKNLLSLTQSTYTKFTVLKASNVTAVSSLIFGSATQYAIVRMYDSSGTELINGRTQASTTANIGASGILSTRAIAGDYFIAYANASPTDSIDTNFSITATAISDNVVTSYQPSDSLGELRFLPKNAAPKGFIPALGSSIGKTAGTYQGDAYYDLYKVLWTQSSVTAGEPYVISSAKGADAATDWAANKTITIDVSGLVVRAYKSGTTAAVGAKQADAMQGHVHQTPTYGTVGTGYFITSQQVASYAFGNLYSNTPSSDGTNGTPRTSSETRMTNIAQYAFIRYGNDAPTLLALPVSKENRFEAVIANNGTASISSQNVDWINSVSRTALGQVTINYAKLGLTAIPSITLGSLSGIVRINSISTTQAVIYTANTSTSDADLGFHIKLSKQSPDYTAPGVFVGNVQPDWQYDLTVTGTNWTTTRAVGVVYKMASGQYRLKFNIHGSVSAETRPSYAISLTGVTFKNIANFFQSVSGNTRSSTTNYVSECTPNSGTITAYHASISGTEYMFSGDVELESKPTWATQTP